MSYGYVIKLFDEIDEKLFFKMDGNSKLLHLLIILITEKNFFQPKLFKIFCDHFMKIIDTNMGKIIIEKMIKNNNNSFIAKRVKDEIYKNLLPIILDPHNKKIINLFLRRTKLENSHNNAINLFDEIIDCDDLYTENIILNVKTKFCFSKIKKKVFKTLL
ncbi:hypothetical protein MHBO_002750 [Bonamia ostreae]|uniref:Uncharacterized protein n=1 Tax=Bonamia ostreae TaxID=126728 RepID=A0ABV2ANE9_9EUKA